MNDPMVDTLFSFFEEFFELYCGDNHEFHTKTMSMVEESWYEGFSEGFQKSLPARMKRMWTEFNEGGGKECENYKSYRDAMTRFLKLLGEI